MGVVDGADDGAVDLRLDPGGAHVERRNLGIVASRFIHPIGGFSGTLHVGGRKLVLSSSTQTPHYVHRALARALAMPAAHIRVIATPNGGGFGGKSDPFNHEIVVAKAAWMLDRPVKVCLTREEVFYCHRGRHPVLMWVKTGWSNDGQLLGMDFQSFVDGGATSAAVVANTATRLRMINTMIVDNLNEVDARDGGLL